MGTDPGTSGSLSHEAWYHDSSGTTHTPPRRAGAVCTPSRAQRSRTRCSLPSESYCPRSALRTWAGTGGRGMGGRGGARGCALPRQRTTAAARRQPTPRASLPSRPPPDPPRHRGCLGQRRPPQTRPPAARAFAPACPGRPTRRPPAAGRRPAARRARPREPPPMPGWRRGRCGRPTRRARAPWCVAPARRSRRRRCCCPPPPPGSKYSSSSNNNSPSVSVREGATTRRGRERGSAKGVR